MPSAAFETREGTTALYPFTILGEDGNPISNLDLDTLTVTLYNEATAAIINTRDGQDALGTGDGANGVAVDDAGLVQFTMVPADNAIVDGTSYPIGTRERHIILFKWTYGGGLKAGNWDVAVDVLNIGKIS